MKKIPYVPGTDYDSALPILVSKIKEHIKLKDQSYFILIIGATGTGKSTLMMHIYNLFDAEGASTQYIAMAASKFVDALKLVKEKPQPRFLCYDEANVSKRDSLTKWNRDLIDTYFSIRGKNIFNVWCNPSVEVIDRIFINDIINGVLLVKENKLDHKNLMPRRYYWIKKTKLLQYYDKYKELKIEGLITRAEKYCEYYGYFRDYNGHLRKDYRKEKEERMDFKIDNLHLKYGSHTENNNLVRPQIVATILHLKPETVTVHCRKGTLKEGIHWEWNGNKTMRMLYINKVEEMERILKENRINSTINLYKNPYFKKKKELPAFE